MPDQVRHDESGQGSDAMIGPVFAIAAAMGASSCDDRQGGDIVVAQCWGETAAAADKELNRIWPEVRAAARRSDKVFEPTPRRDEPSAEADLLKAQRNWIIWRDAECAARSDWAQGGSLQNVIFSQCTYTLTRDRTEQLQQLLKDFTES